MNVIGASADLKRAISNAILLQNGILTVTQPAMGAPNMLYTIKIEGIRVTGCSESMGCNAAINSTAIINAALISWDLLPAGWFRQINCSPQIWV